MTWTFAKIVAAGALTALPLYAVSLPATASAASGPTHSVRPAPADPPNDPTPPPPHGEYYNPNDANDWWVSGDAGGGGG